MDQKKKLIWEEPKLTKMDAADAKAGFSHHADSGFFRRTIPS